MHDDQPDWISGFSCLSSIYSFCFLLGGLIGALTMSLQNNGTLLTWVSCGFVVFGSIYSLIILKLVGRTKRIVALRKIAIGINFLMPPIITIVIFDNLMTDKEPIYGVLVLSGICFFIIISLYCATHFMPRSQQKCQKCGYDLRGTETLRCPECGVSK